MNYLEDTVTGMFLLILALAGGFISPLFNCQSQYLLTNNMYAKHLVLLFVLYFTVSFVGDDEDPKFVQYSLLTLLVYILFIMFTKMNLIFTMIVFVLLFISYNLNLHVKSLKKKNIESKYSETIKKIQSILGFVIVLVIIIGFISYFNYQRSEYKNNWSTLKFLFGVTTCQSLK